MFDSRAAEVIAKECRHLRRLPALAPVTSPSRLRAMCEAGDGPRWYFSADTVRWFGARNFHIVAPGVSVECQTKAPADTGRYLVTAWAVWAVDGDGTVKACPLVYCATLAEARRLAAAVAAVWGSEVCEIAHALVRDGWDAAEAVVSAAALVGGAS